jgi:asparaginase
MSAAIPRVAIFSTGGTIASKRGVDGAASPNLTADDLIAAVPQLEDIANIEAVSFRQVASSELTVSDVIALAESIGRAVADGAIGTVITRFGLLSRLTSGALTLRWPKDLFIPGTADSGSSPRRRVSDTSGNGPAERRIQRTSIRASVGPMARRGSATPPCIPRPAPVEPSPNGVASTPPHGM